MSFRGANALYVARKLGLASGLKLCLDAGDAASLPASATSWLDLSGNGYDFFLGATGAGEATDPTINGTAGQLAVGNYLSFDGGDYLKYDSANESWMENLHKDNALFTVIAWCYWTDFTTNNPVFGDLGGLASHTGANFRAGGAGSYQFLVGNAGSIVKNIAPAAFGAAVTSVWKCVGLSVNEAAASGFIFDSGASSSFDATYSSPSSGSATYTLELGTLGNATTIVRSGTRMAMVNMWEGRALSLGEMNAFYNATRGRFGV